MIISLGRRAGVKYVNHGGIYVDSYIIDVDHNAMSLMSIDKGTYITTTANEDIHGQSYELALYALLKGRSGMYTGVAGIDIKGALTFLLPGMVSEKRQLFPQLKTSLH